MLLLATVAAAQARGWSAWNTMCTRDRTVASNAVGEALRATNPWLNLNCSPNTAMLGRHAIADAVAG